MTTFGPVSLPPQNTLDRSVQLLLNAAHALDHLVLLIFASAVSLIAIDLGVDRWEDLMPYTTGAFLMFGLGSIPAGRLGDLWGRRKSMLLFFFRNGGLMSLGGRESGKLAFSRKPDHSRYLRLHLSPGWYSHAPAACQSSWSSHWLE